MQQPAGALKDVGGDYPWTVVPLERRDDYMAALESASVEGNIRPFAELLAELRGGSSKKS